MEQSSANNYPATDGEAQTPAFVDLSVEAAPQVLGHDHGSPEEESGVRPGVYMGDEVVIDLN